MKFKALKIQNHNIATYHSDGTEKTFVFIHANSIGAASFYKQMISKEGQKYKFISIDMPGHGASDFSLKPKEIYTLDSIATLMAETINELDVENCILIGHSLGGHIALRMVNKSNKIKGVVLANMSPIKNYNNLTYSYKVNDTFNLFFKPKINENEASKLAQVFVKDNVLADISFVDNIKNTDPNFRFVLGESFKTDNTNDFDLISKINIPIAMIYGEKDKIINLNSLKDTGIEKNLWRNKIQIISNTGHSSMWENPNIFNYILIEFAKTINLS